MLEHYEKRYSQFCEGFHKHVILPKAIIASFLNFIMKSDNLQDLEDYIPILLVSCLYKIVSKMLATRLKRVIGGLISSSQPTFIPSRQILDGGVVANEILDLDKKDKREF